MSIAKELLCMATEAGKRLLLIYPTSRIPSPVQYKQRETEKADIMIPYRSLIHIFTREGYSCNHVPAPEGRKRVL